MKEEKQYLHFLYRLTSDQLTESVQTRYQSIENTAKKITAPARRIYNGILKKSDRQGPE
jgi:hypothetical protein